MLRSQRFYSYLFSYIAMIAVLLLLVGSVVNGAFLNILRKEVESSTISTLGQFRDTIELRMSEMERMALHIKSNPSLTPYKVNQGGYGAFQAVNELKKYRDTNLFVHDILLYHKVRSGSQLYAASGTYDTDDFFDSLYRYRNWDVAKWRDFLSEVNEPTLLPMGPVSINKLEGEYQSIFVYPIPSRAGNPYGVVLFFINGAAFEQIAKSVLSGASGMLFILDEQRNILYRYERPMEGLSPEAVLAPTDKALRTIESNGRRFSVIQLSSDNNRLSYVAVLPHEQWMNQVEHTRNIFFMTIGMVFLLGLGIALIFSRRHYKPLRRLASAVKPYVPNEPQEGRVDEFDMIVRTVGKLAEEKEGLLHHIRSQAHAVRQQAVFSLLKGKIQSPADWERWKTMLQYSNLKLDDPYFAVLVVLIDDYEQFQKFHSPMMQDIMKYSMIKVFEEIAMEAGEGVGIEQVDGRSMIFLLNMKEAFANPDYINELAAKVSSFFKQYFRQTVTIGIGNIYREVSNIYDSYVEASSAARYRFVKGCGQIINMMDVEPHHRAGYRFPVQWMHQLSFGIRQGNASEAEASVEHALRFVVESGLSLEAAECICFDLINTILKTFIELDMEMDPNIDDALRNFSLSKFETIEELERLAAGLCRSVCLYVENQKESKNLQLLEQLKQYIHARFTDPSLQLEQIADAFGLTASYATRFFKNQTGIPLMRYVDQLRMEQAKQLLRTTDLQLKDITEAVGYVDITNFIRKFKKYEGITPIRYRNVIKAEQGSAMPLPRQTM